MMRCNIPVFGIDGKCRFPPADIHFRKCGGNCLGKLNRKWKGVASNDAALMSEGSQWPGPGRARRDQNDTVVVNVTRRGSPTAMIRLLLLDG